jgi:hypothetical protein
MRHRPLPVGPGDRRTRLPVGFTLGAAFAGAFVVVTLAKVLAVPEGWGVLMVALVVGLSSIDAEWLAALGAVVLGWLFLTGFVINGFGQLRVTGRGDAARLALLVVVATVFTAASRVRGRVAGHTGRIAGIPRATTLRASPRPGPIGPAADTPPPPHSGSAAAPL